VVPPGADGDQAIPDVSQGGTATRLETVSCSEGHRGTDTVPPGNASNVRSASRYHLYHLYTCTTEEESEQAEFTSSRLQPPDAQLRPTRRRRRRLNAELAQAGELGRGDVVVLHQRDLVAASVGFAIYLFRPLVWCSSLLPGR
jgi:hypothetical protein